MYAGSVSILLIIVWSNELRFERLTLYNVNRLFPKTSNTLNLTNIYLEKQELITYGHNGCCYLLPYLLTHSMKRSPSRGFQLVKNFPAFHGTQRVVTAFISAHHLSLSWTSSIQSITPHPTFWRSILIYPPIYAWVFQVVFSRRFLHQNPVYVSPYHFRRYMLRPPHCSRFYHPNNIGWVEQIIKLLIM